MTGCACERGFKMRLIACALGIVFLLGFLMLRAPPVFAQTFAQGGGAIYGTVYGFTWDDRLVPLAWVQVTASDPVASGPYALFTTSTEGNGAFLMYVPVGTYNLTVSPQGYVAHSSMVSVSDGSSSTATFYLEESHIPIPEFPTQMVSVMMVMAVAATLLARRTNKGKR